MANNQDWRWQSLLNQAHLESERAAPDIKRMGSLLYEALHTSRFHPDAWFAAFMCYRRVSSANAMQRCWQEATGNGNAEEYIKLAARYH